MPHNALGGLWVVLIREILGSTTISVVDLEGFEKLGSKVVDTTEMSTIEPDENGDLHLRYRGNDFICKLPKKEEKS